MTADKPTTLVRLERGFTGSILLLALAAPLSIAATQTAWSLALLFWLLRLVYVRPSFARDGISIVVLVFVGLTLISSIFSYEPEVSLRKMVGVSLVSITFLVASAVKTESLRRTVTIILITSATFSAIYSIANTAIGRNLKVVRMTAESPLKAAGVQENDTIQKVDGVSVNSPTELAAAIATNSADGAVELTVYRYELFHKITLPVAGLSRNDTHVSRLSQRLGLTREKTPEKIEVALMKLVPQADWTLFSHWLIWHGRRRCDARKPDCVRCEIRDLCPTGSKVAS